MREPRRGNWELRREPRPVSRRQFVDSAGKTGAAAIFAAALGGGEACAAANWTTLRGRILYDGTPPVPERLTITKDQEVCGQCPLFDETLLVHRENQGVKNVIVWLQVGGRDTVRVHDRFKHHEHGKVLMQSKYCRFEPHVMVVRTTQQLVFRNADPKADGLKIASLKNPGINVTLPPQESCVQAFSVAERRPVRVTCPIHPWELGWLVITDHPYVAVTDENGRFEIPNVPSGNRRFMFWQEKAGYLSDVTIHDQRESWRRGILELDLEPGDRDLGEIIVQPSLFT